MIDGLFAGVPVVDFERAVLWYGKIFGRAPDVNVSEGREVMWRVVGDGWIYVVRDPDRAGKSLVTMLVDDLDHQIAALAARGIEIPDMEIAEGLYRKIALEDPDGNRISFGETVDEGDSA